MELHKAAIFSFVIFLSPKTILCLGKSKRSSALVAAVEKATENFIQRGEEIAYENPDITQEMLVAVDEVRKTGQSMSVAAREFADDPCSSLKV